MDKSTDGGDTTVLGARRTGPAITSLESIPTIVGIPDTLRGIPTSRGSFEKL